MDVHNWMMDVHDYIMDMDICDCYELLISMIEL